MYKRLGKGAKRTKRDKNSSHDGRQARGASTILTQNNDIMDYYEMAKTQYSTCFCCVPYTVGIGEETIVEIKIDLGESQTRVCEAKAKVIGQGTYGKVFRFVEWLTTGSDWDWLDGVVMKSISILDYKSRRLEEDDLSDKTSTQKRKLPESLREAVLTKFLADADVGTPCDATPIVGANGTSTNFFVASETTNMKMDPNIDDQKNIFIFMNRMSGDLSQLKLETDNSQWSGVEEQLRKRASKMIEMGILCTDMKPQNVLYSYSVGIPISVYFTDFGVDFCCAADSKVASIMEKYIDGISCSAEKDSFEEKHYRNLILGMVGSMLQDSSGKTAPILKKEIKYVKELYHAQYLSGKALYHFDNDEDDKANILLASRFTDADIVADSVRYYLEPSQSPFASTFDHYAIIANDDLFDGKMEEMQEARNNYLKLLNEFNKNPPGNRWQGWRHVGYVEEEDPKHDKIYTDLNFINTVFREPWDPYRGYGGPRGTDTKF